MTSPKLLLGIAALGLCLGIGSFWLTRRTPGAPPQDEIQTLFRTEASGAGTLVALQPPPVPLRTVRWVGPLPGGAAVAQVLTQTGQQRVVLFQNGQLGPTLSLPCPPGVSASFFQFADLVDAIVAPGEAMTLLYRSANAAEPALILAWDLRSDQMKWAHRAKGAHLALSPDRRSVFLYGEGSVSILDLASAARTSILQVELPQEVGEISSLLPTGPRSFLAAHGAGLSAWHQGSWAHTKAPMPSPLGFSRGLGALAGSAKTAWWQPEPGLLIPLDPKGLPGESRNLKVLLPEAAALDADLLRLLGADASGALWFGLARPTLPSAPAPVQEAAQAPAGEPSPLAEPSPSLPGAQAPVPSRDPWEAHLKQGLDRVYRWKPGEETMAVLTWAEAWKNLAPPAGFVPPTGDAGLRPEAGALTFGAPERLWWLPLPALQPR